ncbi:nonribosomal peptide synthetase MxaA [Methylobacillus gramineus]|uniref:nonribosomal peptide synthetase MxaA n=1 Tax=Methylobacillus gramineus TaxID=755169 RepID=UPI001CFFBBB6|nr:nonribosomal peptide synthetase MxaA [Methylobacillus gramineus]MCB5184923.1 nonribosomal peptide synthetase MxaA [Methylobacillus gramineus]
MMLLIGGLIAVLGYFPAASAADEQPGLQIINPAKSYGIQVGDTLSRRIVLDLPAGSTIAKAGVPLKGSKAEGIELVGVEVSESDSGNGRQYSLRLDYQVFASSAKPVVMRLPQASLKMSAQDGQESVLTIPQWPFWFSPLVVSSSGKAGINMQAQFRPPAVEVAKLHAWLGVCVCLVVSGLLALIYINADKKWLPFMGGAFAHAHRRIKRLKATPGSTKEAFYHMHAAFNQWYGGNCFAQDIDSFVQQNPRFGKSREDIARFFTSSNEQLFFGQAKDASEVIKELKQLSKQFRNCERGVA